MLISGCLVLDDDGDENSMLWCFLLLVQCILAQETCGDGCGVTTGREEPLASGGIGHHDLLLSYPSTIPLKQVVFYYPSSTIPLKHVVFY